MHDVACEFAREIGIIVVVWGQVKRENSSLPVTVRVSKMRVLKAPYKIIYQNAILKHVALTKPHNVEEIHENLHSDSVKWSGKALINQDSFRNFRFTLAAVSLSYSIFILNIIGDK